MSSLEAEDDTELRDLVANTLVSSGVLGKIKAQLRSNVYLALDGGEKHLRSKSTLSNHLLSNFAKSSEGRLVLYLVREFLAFFKLDCTLSVFEAEAIEGRHLQLRDRDDLIEKLGLVNERIGELHGNHVFEKVPLLSEVLRLSKVTILKSETPSPTEISHSSLNPSINNKSQPITSNNPSIASHQINLGPSLPQNIETVTPFQARATQEPHKKVPVRENQIILSTIVSEDSNSHKMAHQFAASKSSSSSSFSSVDQSLSERHPPRDVLSTQSSLGDLPPLGGQSSARNTLSPLKKFPSNSTNKSSESSISKEKTSIGIHDIYSDLDVSGKSSSQGKSKTKKIQKHTTNEIPFPGSTSTNDQVGVSADRTFTKGPLVSRDNSFSRTNSKLSDDPIIGKDDKLDSNDDDDIEEDIDNFLESQASEGDEFTKDETVASGEDTSMKADFILDLRS